MAVDKNRVIDKDEGLDKNRTEARQGVTGQGVRWVLYIGTALAVIVLFGYLLGWV